MTVINTIKVLNKSVESREEELVISTEWSNEKVKIMILRDCNTPFVGEAQFNDFNKYAESFDKPLSVYIDELKDIFCIKKTNIDFYLKGDKFFWKRKILALGQVFIKPVTDIGVMAMYTVNLINQYSNIKFKEMELEKENNHLKLINSEITSQLSTMVSLKNQLETNLYKKFSLLLNAKKEKIRSLKSKIDMNTDNDFYNDSTEESESESEPAMQSKNESVRYSKKRLLESIEVVMEEKKKKTESCAHNSKMTENNTEKAGSFVNEKVLQDDEETPDFVSDESICEMELKLEEECAINQEQSSEEMF